MLNDKNEKGQMKIPSPSTNLKSHSKEKRWREYLFVRNSFQSLITFEKHFHHFCNNKTQFKV